MARYPNYRTVQAVPEIDALPDKTVLHHVETGTVWQKTSVGIDGEDVADIETEWHLLSPGATTHLSQGEYGPFEVVWMPRDAITTTTKTRTK